MVVGEHKAMCGSSEHAMIVYYLDESPQELLFSEVLMHNKSRVII